MNKNNFLSFILVVGLALLALYSCNQPTVVENKTVSNGNLLKQTKKEVRIIGYKTITENGKEKKVPIYDGDPNGSNGTKQLSCEYKIVDHYELDHYEVKGNKRLGIWDVRKLKAYSEYSSKWGFSMVYVRDDNEADNAIAGGFDNGNGGFDPNKLLARVSINNGTYTYPLNHHYYYYFLDEPIELGYTSGFVVDIADNIASHNSDAKLLISSYQTRWYVMDDYDDILDETSNTQMMCDQYDGDQRSDWTKFKNEYGSSRVKSHWISLMTDGGEGDFSRLFAKANDFGINKLWLYADIPDKDGHHYSNEFVLANINYYIGPYCNTAFNYGWLRKFMKYYHYWYKCHSYHNDPCWCKKNDDGWELDHIEYMGVEEVYPN